jgi:hypothetical protein
MKLVKFNFIAMLFIFIAACATSNQPFSAHEKWHRANTSTQEKIEIMKACGYPNSDGAASEPDHNKIAMIQLCMEAKDFKYKGKYGTFCKNYPLLPACMRAVEEKAAR